MMRRNWNQSSDKKSDAMVNSLQLQKMNDVNAFALYNTQPTKEQNMYDQAELSPYWGFWVLEAMVIWTRMYILLAEWGAVGLAYSYCNLKQMMIYGIFCAKISTTV